MSLNFLLQIEPSTVLPSSPTGVVEKSLWEIVQDSNGNGGWIINLWLTLMLGYVIFIFVERFLALNKASKEDSNFLVKVKEFMLDGKIDVAKDDRDRPDWMGSVDFSDLKIKLVASILAISGIGLLETFLKIAGSGDVAVSEVEIKWMVIIHIIFIISGLLLAMMDYVAHRSSKH